MTAAAAAALAAAFGVAASFFVARKLVLWVFGSLG